MSRLAGEGEGSLEGGGDEARHLADAVALAVRNVSAGGGPFGAVLITGDGQRFEGVNRVTSDCDPTAHAEVSAIRAACAALGTHSLAGATLYSSCEPCPMCLASALWARVERVYFAADRHDAAKSGFDDAAFYAYFEGERDALLPVRQVAVASRSEPFDAWDRSEERVDY